MFLISESSSREIQSAKIFFGLVFLPYFGERAGAERGPPLVTPPIFGNDAGLTSGGV